MKSAVFPYILKRDLLISFRCRSEFLQPLLFFIVVVFLFSIALSQRILVVIPEVIWVATLLATLLSSEYLFRHDLEDGTLEQFVLSPSPLFFFVIAKVLAHWLVTGLPLVLVSPLIGFALDLKPHGVYILTLSLLLGTPTLYLVGAIGNALTVSLHQNFLLGIIVLPLYIPILIFGTASVTLAVTNMSANAPLALLAALLVLSFTFAPFAIAGALKAGI